MAAVDGEESLRFLSVADPPLYLSPSADLSCHARGASRHLYSSLLPFCPKRKPPLDELLVGESFDAEQIWCQIDLVSRPIVSMLRREVRRIEQEPPRPSAPKKEEMKEEDEEKEEEEEEEDNDEEKKEEEDDEEDEEGSDDDEEEDKEGNGVEDGFLKIKELEEYLVKDEAREYVEIKGKKRKKVEEDDDDNDDEEDGDDDDDDDEDNDADLHVNLIFLNRFY